MRSLRSPVTVIALAGALVVLGFTIAQAVREDSLAPVWMAGWLPAVIVAIVWPHPRRDCRGRLRRGRPEQSPRER